MSARTDLCTLELQSREQLLRAAAQAKRDAARAEKARREARKQAQS